MNNITGSPVAGRKILAKVGEHNIDQIWPADESLRLGFNEKNRVLDTNDINLNMYNLRMQKVKQLDNEKINKLIAARHASQMAVKKPYKNDSNVFVHLVDDPKTRQIIR